MKKIHNDRGETLIEVLTSIIIGILSVAMMYSCIQMATNMDEKAKALDDEHYAGLSAADVQAPSPEPTSGTVTIERVKTTYNSTASITPEPPSATLSTELDITIYGDAEMSSYGRKTP